MPNPDIVKYRRIWAWHLQSAQKYTKPFRYIKRNGAITWAYPKPAVARGSQVGRVRRDIVPHQRAQSVNGASRCHGSRTGEVARELGIGLRDPQLTLEAAQEIDFLIEPVNIY